MFIPIFCKFLRTTFRLWRLCQCNSHVHVPRLLLSILASNFSTYCCFRSYLFCHSFAKLAFLIGPFSFSFLLIKWISNWHASALVSYRIESMLWWSSTLVWCLDHSRSSSLKPLKSSEEFIKECCRCLGTSCFVFSLHRSKKVVSN